MHLMLGNVYYPPATSNSSGPCWLHHGGNNTRGSLKKNRGDEVGGGPVLIESQLKSAIDTETFTHVSHPLHIFAGDEMPQARTDWCHRHNLGERRG